jgi:hypothetical protein
MCSAIKCKKDHDEGTQDAPALMARMYELMNRFNFSVGVQDTTRFCLKMCEFLCQPGIQEISKLRKDLSHFGLVEATKEEFMKAAVDKNLKQYFVIGKVEESQEERKKLMYLASSDLGNTFYDAWCRQFLLFDSPLNTEHTADLVEALLALYWLQVRASDVSHPFGEFKDLHSGLTKSLRKFVMPTLAQEIGSMFSGAPMGTATGSAASSSHPGATSPRAVFPPPPPHAMTPEGKKQERIAAATEEIAACMKRTNKAVQKLKTLVETPADQVEQITQVSDSEAEDVGNKRKQHGNAAEAKSKVAKWEYTLSITFGFAQLVLEGDDKEAALQNLKELVEEPTSVPMILPEGTPTFKEEPQAMVDFLSSLPTIDASLHTAIKSKSLALLRHSNPSILPMSNFWVSIQHVHQHLARVATWDTPGRYLPGPWNLFKELACSWDGKGYVFQFLVLNFGYDDMQVYVRADPEGRVAHTITTSGVKLQSKTGPKGASKSSKGWGANWHGSTTPPWGDANWNADSWPL